MAGYLSWLTGGRSFKLQVRQRWRKRGNYETKKQKNKKYGKRLHKTKSHYMHLRIWFSKEQQQKKKTARKQRKKKKWKKEEEGIKLDWK